jgi:hypothetical protein
MAEHWRLRFNPHGLQGISPDILLRMRIGCRHIGKASFCVRVEEESAASLTYSKLIPPVVAPEPKRVLGAELTHLFCWVNLVFALIVVQMPILAFAPR